MSAERETMEAAGLWFAQRRMLSAGFDSAAFEAWLAADAQHRAAYAQIEAAAAAIDELKTKRFLKRRLRLWLWIAPAAGLAAAAAAALFVFGPAQAPQARYATGRGEVETFTLADGSTVTLGPVSRIDVRFSAHERRVALTEGEAFFDVTHDPARRFSVSAGDARVVVTGTQFDVRRGNGVVRVAVARGAVNVDAAALPGLSPSAQARLRAGDQVEAPEHVNLLSPPQALTLSQLSPGSAGAWREGHLSYIEAPLAELVADLNRYYAPGIRLSDPALGQIRLTASFGVDDIDTFLSTLPDAAPVALQRAATGEITIAPAN